MNPAVPAPALSGISGGIFAPSLASGAGVGVDLALWLSRFSPRVLTPRVLTMPRRVN
jgi:H+/Cl- antiporter ClcA